MSEIECPVCEGKYSVEGLGVHLSAQHDNQEVREALVSHLKYAAEGLDKPPTRREIDDIDGPSHGMYSARFGSWNEALETAGFSPHQVKPDYCPSAEEVTDEIENVTEELGRLPTQKEMNKIGEFSSNIASERFGSWTGALEAADVPNPDRRYNRIEDEELLEYLRDLGDRLGRPPIKADLEKYSARVYWNRFGGWLSALQKAGFDVGRGRPDVPVPTGEDHWAWVEGTEETTYGKGWNEEKRTKVRRRDGFRCVRCGVAQEKHQALYGRRLDVHHITPARDVDIPERRNSIDNLVSLCVSCHIRVERSENIRFEYEDDTMRIVEED
jgi:RNA polymerase-binding transcription factor DksA